MRVLVCGGRSYPDRGYVFQVLDTIHVEFGPITAVIEGGAAGADSHARMWALRNEVPCMTVEARWSSYGKAAGRIRNSLMLCENPNYVVAFPGGTGTEDMVGQAYRAGLPVSRM